MTERKSEIWMQAFIFVTLSFYNLKHTIYKNTEYMTIRFQNLAFNSNSDNSNIAKLSCFSKYKIIQ